MHIIQQKIFNLSKNQDLTKLTLRRIAELIGENHPQKIKHHLSQLQKKGMLNNSNLKDNSSIFLSIPILGTANCGSGTFFADQNLEGYLKVSSSVIKSPKNIFAIKAHGSSMNKANIKGKQIEEGDYVLIDKNEKEVKNDDYILGIIDDTAVIKKIKIDINSKLVALVSESNMNFSPIIIHQSDLDKFFISGKVYDVIKMNFS